MPGRPRCSGTARAGQTPARYGNFDIISRALSGSTPPPHTRRATFATSYPCLWEADADWRLNYGMPDSRFQDYYIVGRDPAGMAHPTEDKVRQP